MLRVTKINVHHAGEHQHNDDIQQILILPDHRQPSGMRIRIDHADCGRILRERLQHVEGHQLHRYVVHHQCEQRLVRVPPCFEKCGDDRPDRACKDTRREHHKDKQRRRHPVSQVNHTECRYESADQHLTFAADVPEAHLERRRQRQRDTKQQHRLLQKRPNPKLRAECAIQHGRVQLNRGFADDQDKHAAQHNTYRYRKDTDEPHPIPWQLVLLDDMHQRLFDLA